jgi:hypothetical protein
MVLESFFKWIQEYDSTFLVSEDDVETKCILPLFNRLGYPDKCRRGKHPVKFYNHKKKGRPYEIDQVYFTTPVIDEQNEETSLVIVEAKRGTIEKFDDARRQAEFYSSGLKPLIYLLTNGKRITALKYHPHRRAEVIFDDTLHSLKDKRNAKQFFELLNFRALSNLKQQALEEIPYSQYIKLEKALRTYPDLNDLISKGDFKPSKIITDKKISVSKPKVSIEAKRLIAFEYCHLTIRFSHVVRRGLQINLSHQNIYANFMTGLNTDCSWNTRRFLRKLDENNYKAELGQVTTVLSKEEADDLCACLDEVCGEYKRHILKLENLLETKNFMVFSDGTESIMRADIMFYLLTVEPDLWEFMLKFKRDFDFGNGDSEWHIFDERGDWIEIVERGSNGIIRPAMIFSKEGKDKNINLIYSIPAWTLKYLDNWTDHIGPKGIWTAPYTRDWLVNKFIPRVILYAREQCSSPPPKGNTLAKVAAWLKPQSTRHQQDEKDPLLPYHFDFWILSHRHETWEDRSIESLTLSEIEDPKLLYYFLRDIQEWCHFRSLNLTTNIIIPFFNAFAELIKGVDPDSLRLNYLWGNIWMVGRGDGKKYSCNSDEISHFSEVIEYFKHFSEQVGHYPSICSSEADFLFRVCMMLPPNICRFKQHELNAVKKSLQPLWELCDFEGRYVNAHRSWNGLYYEDD